MGEWRQLIEGYQQLVCHREPAGFALILQKRGHSFRPRGTLALYSQSGLQFGHLGTCLDEDLKLRFQKAWQKEEFRSWLVEIPPNSLGPNCGGGQQLWLQTFVGEHPLLEALVKAHREYQKLYLQLVASPQGSPELRWFLSPPSSPLSDQSESESPFALFPVEPHLILLGAVPVAEYMGKMAQLLGWSVEVWDCRTEYLSAPWVSQLGKSQLGRKGEDFPLPQHPYWAFLSLAHVDWFEEDLLAHVLLYGSPFYIGLMASRHRRESLWQALEKRGLSKLLLANIHSPIGLPLGGKAPSEIALATVAEIQKCWQDTLKGL